MNIIELCLSPGLGGLELYVFRSSEALNNSKTGTNKVIAVLSRESKLDYYFQKNSTITAQYIKGFFNPLPLLNAKKLAGIIDQNNIDVIHMHWGKDLPLAALAKTLSKRKPALVYTRQMMITRVKNDAYHNFQYRQINRLLTITKELESLCKQYIAVAKDNIQTLYYGVKAPDKLLNIDNITALKNNTGFNQNDFVAGLFGRLEEGKGQHLLIKAIALAKNNNKQIKALIVGHEMNTGYREVLENMAKKLGVAENIIFNDFVDNPQNLMQICDCVCLTSYEETFGLVLPEAMRAGIAVIGSNKGGVPEIIDHKITGLLFESRDEVSLHEQINYLYDNPVIKNEIARQGKLKADDVFNNDKHFLSLENILKSVSQS